MLRTSRFMIEGIPAEEYASFWGCDGSYDKPGHEGEGALFYNFSSERQKRDAEYLRKFIKAIEYEITIVKGYVIGGIYTQEDVNSLNKLLNYVKSLKPEV